MTATVKQVRRHDSLNRRRSSPRSPFPQVLSADSIVLRGQPKGGPPPERNLGLSGIVAPRLGRRGDSASESKKDEVRGALESSFPRQYGPIRVAVRFRSSRIRSQDAGRKTGDVRRRIQGAENESRVRNDLGWKRFEGGKKRERDS